MKRVSVSLFALWLSGSLFTWAAEAIKTGTLVDANCGPKIAADAAKASGHKVSCAKSDNCKNAGYGIVADGKFLKFDKTGDAQAWNILEKTSKESEVKVTVTGHLEGNNLQVSKIEEAK
ncbi:MAG: hypothetical protein HY645_06185 [Acidobacteria bacterium]|nr:hypothetical protein [Acidobacteriota bacterium]